MPPIKRNCKRCHKECWGKYCRSCFGSIKLGKGSNSRVNRIRRYRRKNGLKVGDVDGI